MAKKRKKRKSKSSSSRKKKIEQDISNKALAGLLIAAIVISVSGTLMVMDKSAGLTGFATEQNGTASINITGFVSIALPSTSIDFGNGVVTAGNTNADVAYVPGTGTVISGGSGWSANGDIIVENDGNVAANISINAVTAVSSFIGGTSPAMSYKAFDSEGGSCTGLQSTFTSLTTSPTLFCSSLGFADSADTVKLGLNFTIPSDSVGQKSNTITFTAASN